MFVGLYDAALGVSERAGLRARRRSLLARASGRTLEIGAGTGLNLPLYPRGLRGLVVSEPDAAMHARLRRRAVALGRPATVVAAPAEGLPFADGSFDTVVSTLVLCTVPDLERSLDEVARVLAVGGRLLFLEHVRSKRPGLARWQDRLAPLWQRFAEGCRCNRETLAAIGSRFDLADAREGEVPRAPPLVRPMVEGVAVRR